MNLEEIRKLLPVVDAAVGLGALGQHFYEKPRSAPVHVPSLPSRGPDARSYSPLRAYHGVGANNANAPTVSAAQALDDWYSKNGCAGCDDLRSELRVRTLAFKAACLTDPQVAGNVSLNTTTYLAATGLGPGTDAALSYVLGAARSSSGHCTDDNGSCLNASTPVVSGQLQNTIDSMLAQINGAIVAFQQLPAANQVAAQGNILGQLETMIAAIANQIGFVVQGQGGATPIPVPVPEPTPVPAPKVETTTTTTTAPPESSSSGLKIFLIGGLLGLAATGGALVYHYRHQLFPTKAAHP